jgi:hypothetical protein
VQTPELSPLLGSIWTLDLAPACEWDDHGRAVVLSIDILGIVDNRSGSGVRRRSLLAEIHDLLIVDRGADAVTVTRKNRDEDKVR